MTRRQLLTKGPLTSSESSKSNVQSILDAPFQIQPAKREDMHLVQKFVRSSADWYRPILDEKDMGEHEVDDTWAEQNFKRRNFYIGYARKTPVGTISMQNFQEDIVYLGYIYLDTKFVGRGYGARLIKYAKKKAEQDKRKQLALICHPEAAWAKKAYLKFGFKVSASQKRDVLSWNNGALQDYYEEGFELLTYNL